jgi:hypothetical protein
MRYFRYIFLLILLSLAVPAMPGPAFAFAPGANEYGQRKPRQKKLKSTSLTGWTATRKTSVKAHVRQGKPVRAHTRKVRIN